MGDRHRIRACWHDYNSGIYFVTICARDKSHILGKIEGGVFHKSPLGAIVEKHICAISSHYRDVEVWNYVIMPNHVHMVIAVGTRFIASGPREDSSIGCLKSSLHGDTCVDFHHNSRLGAVVGAFKAGVSREARTRLIASLPCWQSRFHEHIIRNQQSLDAIMYYIDNNVENWASDTLGDAPVY